MQGSAAQAWGPHIADSEQDAFEAVPHSRWLREPAPLDWLVEGCFLRATVGLLAGDGGIGKSLLMQQLCTAAALGHDWLGLRVKPCRALHLACEDGFDVLHRRQIAINRSLGVAMEDVLEAGLDIRPRVAQDNTLMVLDRQTWRMRRTWLMDRLVSHCRHAGIQLVVLDTATKTFGGNQNDEKQVSDFIAECYRLAIAISGCVILTKHPSITGRALGTGESGSVAWENSVRARLYLREHKARGLELAGMKSNYSRKLDPVPVAFEGGVLVRTAPTLRDFSEPRS